MMWNCEGILPIGYDCLRKCEIVKITQGDGASDRSVHGNLVRIQCGKMKKRSTSGEIIAPGSRLTSVIIDM